MTDQKQKLLNAIEEVGDNIFRTGQSPVRGEAISLYTRLLSVCHELNFDDWYELDRIEAEDMKDLIRSDEEQARLADLAYERQQEEAVK